MIYFVLLLFAAVGHTVLWVGLVNRVHGLGIHRRWVNAFTLFCVAMFVALPIAIAALLVPSTSGAGRAVLVAAGWCYAAACAAFAVVAALQRWQWRRHCERNGALRANHSEVLDVADAVAEPLTAPGVPRLLSRVPGNQVLTICVQEKQLEIPRLAAAHEGLRIIHLTDLHMSGRIARAYFEYMVERVNERDADVVAVTGDLIERSECLDWAASTFGRLRARSGVYYVLGNHDRRVGKERITAALDDAGLIYLGGTWRELAIRGAPLILAGNELPWFGPAANLSEAGDGDGVNRPLRILLAHSPDQFGWAQKQGIDLMLAGHNHGGQIRLPLLGAIVAPSLHGVRYAAGTFRSGDTVLHVSRGSSSLTPFRWGCPPELAVLELRAACRPA